METILVLLTLGVLLWYNYAKDTPTTKGQVSIKGVEDEEKGVIRLQVNHDFPITTEEGSQETQTVTTEEKPNERVEVGNINRDNKLTKEQEDWYDNYLETFCGVGSTKVKYKLTAAAKKNLPFAKAYRAMLEIGDQHSRMINARIYAKTHPRDPYRWEEYQKCLSKKEKAIGNMIQLCIKEGYKFGVSGALENTLSILYVEFDSMAFATYWKLTDNATRDILPTLPSETQEVTVEDILPRLEKVILRKYYNKDGKNIKNEAISCPSETLSQSVG